MENAYKLFLIEDEEQVAFLIRKHLERAGHHVTWCKNAKDALIVLRHGAFDLILLDKLLKQENAQEEEIDGLELLHILTKEGITVPVVMVTGRGDQDLATQVLRAGALDY